MESIIHGLARGEVQQRTCASEPRPSTELTDRFSYGPLLLQARYNATPFRATPSPEHRQVAA